MRLFAALSVLAFLNASALLTAQQTHFSPGEVWKDTGGNPINAHGGGLLLHKDSVLITKVIFSQVSINLKF